MPLIADAADARLIRFFDTRFRAFRYFRRLAVTSTGMFSQCRLPTTAILIFRLFCRRYAEDALLRIQNS